MSFICDICQKEFLNGSQLGGHRKCAHFNFGNTYGRGEKVARVAWTCKECGAEHKALPCYAKMRSFCDINCRAKFYSGEKSVAKRKEVREKHSQRMKFNNPMKRPDVAKKVGEAQSGENHAFYGKKRPEHSKMMSGDGNPAWLGGKTFEIYPSEFNKAFKKKIKARDSFSCRICFKKEKDLDYTLRIHHIDYNKKNNRHSNLISLCISCHGKTNFRREEWSKTENFDVRLNKALWFLTEKMAENKMVQV